MNNFLQRYGIAAIALGLALYFQQTDQMVICFLWIGVALAFIVWQHHSELSRRDRQQEFDGVYNTFEKVWDRIGLCETSVLQSCENEIRDLQDQMNDLSRYVRDEKNNKD